MAPEPDFHTAAAEDSGTTRPGHDLRSARERAGVSLESMAERLRLSVAQLEALELDDYAELPPPAFVRGYLRAYARDLGLEPEAFVSAYDATGGSDHDPQLRLTGATEAASGGRGPLIGLLLILLVAVGGLGAWWYQQRMGGPADTVGAATAQTEESTATGSDGGNEAEAAGASGDANADDEGAGDTEGAGTSGNAGEAGTNGAGAGGDGEDTAGPSTDAAATTGAADAADGEGATSGGDAEETASAAADTAAANGEATTNPPEMASAEAASEAAAAGAPAADDTATAGAGEGNGGDGDAGTGATTADAGAAGEPATAGTASEAASEAEPGASTPDATDSPTLAATSAAGTGPDRIVLEFDGRSWLEVYDSRDRELMYTLYYGSDPVELRGWAPFEVFLGNSPAVEVRFNGETIDKSAFTRSDNTARFVVDASGARAR